MVGIRLAQKLGDGWELIGVAETGFNPYSFSLINGPRSIADNNLLALSSQKTQYDTSRAGQWDNSQGFFGVSNPKYGTLTFGRTNTLSQSAIGAFDPVASVAFSQLGFSAVYAGFGAGPTNRINTAVTYRLTYQGFRFAAQTQVGGYDQGNAATGAYQLQVGTDIGKLAFDAIGGFARNAVTLSSFSGVAIPPGFDPTRSYAGRCRTRAGLPYLQDTIGIRSNSFGIYLFVRRPTRAMISPAACRQLLAVFLSQPASSRPTNSTCRAF